MQQPTVVVLPPGAAPRQFTANVIPDTLYEHFFAFLNANNPGGFKREEVKLVGAATVGELMLLAATSDEMGERQFKETAKRIKKGYLQSSGIALESGTRDERTSASPRCGNWQIPICTCRGWESCRPYRAGRSELTPKMQHIAFRYI